MIFDKTAETLTAAVHYAGIRHKVTANNIANVDTPGYKAMDVSFREQLADFMSAQKSGSMPIPPAPPTLVLAPDLDSTRPRIDYNTVNIDQELAKLSQNTIFHNTCLQLLSSKFRILKYAISGNL